MDDILCMMYFFALQPFNHKTIISFFKNQYPKNQLRVLIPKANQHNF
jgi:hypothetical protein